MGSRECRRVPPDWEHPKDEQGSHRPLYTWNGQDEMDEMNREWMDDGDDPLPRSAWMPEWPPEVATHYMMYETCSEGTPISPTFATPEECARWCADNKVSAFGSKTSDYEWWLRVIEGRAGYGLLMGPGGSKAF